jgi:membrane protein implicated in regulation of membrane protease activity
LFLGHGDFHAAGGHGHHDGGDHGHGQTAPEFHFPLFSPLALATLFGALGAWGLIARGALDLADTGSLAVAVPAALGTAYLVTYLGWRLATSSRGTSAIRTADLEGALGEVITPIPEGGLGEVAAMVQGQRFSSAARTADGVPIPRGAMVRVVAQVGATLVVKKEG